MTSCMHSLVERKEFSSLNLRRFGNEVVITGAIYTDEQTGEQFLVNFPGESKLEFLTVLDIDQAGWEQLLRQTDQQETEILAKAKDGTITKAIIRKCQRQIDSITSWKVFKRDNYACRYCGNANVPLTVDHLVLWEEGGPTTEENLLSACKKCNKARGNTEYFAWLRGEFYQKVSRDLPEYIKNKNQEIKLDHIPRKLHVSSR